MKEPVSLLLFFLEGLRLRLQKERKVLSRLYSGFDCFVVLNDSCRHTDPKKKNKVLHYSKQLRKTIVIYSQANSYLC